MACALRSFPTGSVPGPSGLRSNHLKEAVFFPSPHRASLTLQHFTGVVNLLCAGRAPQVIVPHLCGDFLLPYRKKDGGLRPIAVGEVLRRLRSKCVARAVLSDALQLLSPLKVWVGLPSGCDAILHSVTSIQGDSSISSDHKLTLLVDFSNAFNSIDRSTMFHETRSHLPSLSSWMKCSYGSQPNLLLDHLSIPSCCCVQLGPLGFALVLHPFIEKIKESVPGLLINAWYLDDGTLCGTENELATALSIIESEGPPRGLFLNRSKSLLYTRPTPPSPIHSFVTSPLRRMASFCSAVQ